MGCICGYGRNTKIKAMHVHLYICCSFFLCICFLSGHTYCLYTLSLWTDQAQTPTCITHIHKDWSLWRGSVNWQGPLQQINTPSIYPSCFCFRHGFVCAFVYICLWLCVNLNSWACGYQKLWSPNSTSALGWQAYPLPPACTGRLIKRKVNRQ